MEKALANQRGNRRAAGGEARPAIHPEAAPLQRKARRIIVALWSLREQGATCRDQEPWRVEVRCASDRSRRVHWCAIARCPPIPPGDPRDPAPTTRPAPVGTQIRHRDDVDRERDVVTPRRRGTTVRPVHAAVLPSCVSGFSECVCDPEVPRWRELARRLPSVPSSEPLAAH